MPTYTGGTQVTGEKCKTIECAVLTALLDNGSRCIAQLETELDHHGPLAVREAIGALEDDGCVERADCDLTVTQPVRHLDVLGVLAI